MKIELKQIFSHRFFRLLLNSFKYGLLTFFIMLIINYAAITKEKELMSTHGLHYDIGLGQKLFMSCKGEGLPTIIMESNAGSNSDIFLPLQKKLAELTRVCVYDRAGLGFSDRPIQPVINTTEPKKPKINRGMEFTLERMSEDLYHLITTSSQAERPIMFISSELGSLVSRFYTQIYQDKVSHLIMINPLVENLLEIDDSVWNDFWYKKYIPTSYSYALGSAIGLNRLLMMVNLIHPQIKFNEQDNFNRQKHLMCNPNHMFSMIDEYINLNETLAQMKIIRSIKPFPENVSVTILTGEHDLMFGVTELFDDKKNSNEYQKLKEAWKKSHEFMKSNLFPKANVQHIHDSIYRRLYNEPEYIFSFIKDLVLDWRIKNEVVNKFENI